jgi:predicted secreted protein
MALLNGNALTLAIDSTSGGEQVFAHSISASLSVNNSLIDTTTVDSNSFEEMISGRKSFSISTDGLADFDDVSNSKSTEQFSDLALAGTKIFFMFTRPETGLAAGDLMGWSGEAFIESFEISRTADDNITYSCSLKGSGELTKVVKA